MSQRSGRTRNCVTRQGYPARAPAEGGLRVYDLSPRRGRPAPNGTLPCRRFAPPVARLRPRRVASCRASLVIAGRVTSRVPRLRVTTARQVYAAAEARTQPLWSKLQACAQVRLARTVPAGSLLTFSCSDRRHLTRMSICIGPCRLPFPMPPNSHMRPLLTRTLPIRASTTPLISARRKARYALQDPYAPPSSPSCHCLSPSHTSSSSSTFSTCRVADLALHRGAAAREALLYAPSRPCRPTHHSRFVLHHLDRLLDLAAPRLSLSLRVQNCGLVPASYSPCDVLERGGLTTKGVAALHYSARLRCPLAVAPMSLIA